jgi:ATP-dependent helicase HrpB
LFLARLDLLPVAEICPALIQSLKQHNKVILSAPPGAGKSTYLPLFLLNHADFSRKTILLLEPRRLAAKSIASYLASQLNESVGQQVGYQIRHEKSYSKNTRLLIVTEGVLIRKIQQDPELAGIDLIIFDEFHERSLQADLALALALEVQQLNSDLQLLIMSATLDQQKLATALDAPVLSSEGRSYPVEIVYQAPTAEPIWLQSARLSLQASLKHQGSILTFLPGQREIHQARDWLLEQNKDSQLDIYALSGALTLAEQQQAIAPSPQGRRKLVLTTNIAETSLTIEGIEVVVDSGLCRQAVYHPKHGLTRLDTVAISQAAATQRAGRAGRLSAGVCYRLDSAELWQRRSAFTPASILQSDLTSLLLEISAWGCSPEQLFWLDQPTQANLKSAAWVLLQLKAINDKGQITDFGRQLLATGTEPRLAALVLHGKQLEHQGEHGAAWLAVVLATLLENPNRSREQDIDQLLQQPLYGALLQQAKQLAQQNQIKVSPYLPQHLTAALLSRAFPDRIAILRGKGYLLTNNAGALLFPDSPLSGAEVLVICDLHFGQSTQISLAARWTMAELMLEWQADMQKQSYFGFDAQQGRFIAEQRLMLGSCVLERKPLTTKLTETEQQQAWLDWLKQQGLQALPWTEKALQLRYRLQLMQYYMPEHQLPKVDDDGLWADVQDWLAPAVGRFTKLNDLNKLDLYNLLWQRLTYQQQQLLNTTMPDSWRSAVGSMIPVHYSDEGEAILSIRIQEMFGQLETPAVANGRLAMKIHLLSPARQPLQVTQDLASFWANSYAEVKKEMKGRYPKHYWPDNPAEAMPTNKTKKAMQK